MHLKTIVSLSAIFSLASAILAPPPVANKIVDAPGTSPRIDTLAQHKCTGYCKDATCGPHLGCCCYAKFQFCFAPKKGERCTVPV
ncbi:hypothetical protein B0H15DRAFT_860580 [Mycena belliarum]|uniref:Uncharacterized protein n=1 Tax=Mycena belliarum TaxID=1033014 RepID=A0AAD6XGZ0_9AGAR|nr:hypothetical protein B0H15DRAFT_860580 [Mycena belliae]